MIRQLLASLPWNLTLVGAWHLAVFIACIRLPISIFNPRKRRYQPKVWERGGKWYRDKLKIQRWKDKVPQYIGRGGFSKEHLADLTPDYLDEFIMETCRAEWMHLLNCICAAAVFFTNPLLPGLFYVGLVLLGNLPFAIIQRYNRFRLQTLREKRFSTV